MVVDRSIDGHRRLSKTQKNLINILFFKLKIDWESITALLSTENYPHCGSNWGVISAHRVETDCKRKLGQSHMICVRKMRMKREEHYTVYYLYSYLDQVKKTRRLLNLSCLESAPLCNAPFIWRFKCTTAFFS